MGAQLPITIRCPTSRARPVTPLRRLHGLPGIVNLTLHAKWRSCAGDRVPWLSAIVQFSCRTGFEAKEFVRRARASSFAGPLCSVQMTPIRKIRLNAEVGYRLVTGDGGTVNFNRRTMPSGGMLDPATNARSTGANTANGDKITYDDQLTFGAGAAFRVTPFVDLIVEGYGNQIVAGTKSLSTELLGGIKIFVQESSYLLIAGACGNKCMPLDGFNQPNYRGILGFIFEPSIGDADRDGYKDDVDACPNDPEDFDDFQDAEGCPDPDNDQDGILDIDDECPLIPEDHDGDSDADGCPEGDGAIVMATHPRQQFSLRRS